MSVKSNKKKAIVISVAVVAVVAAAALTVCFCFFNRDYKEEILKAATCTDTGIARIVGSDCGGIKRTKEIPALGHNVVRSGAVLPTHYEEGLTEAETCSRCKQVIKAAETINRLRYVVLCSKFESHSLGVGGNVNFAIDGLDPIFVGSDSADYVGKEFASIIESVPQSERGGGYVVYEASIGKELSMRISPVDGCFVCWSAEDAVLSSTDSLTYAVPENDVAIYIDIKKIFDIEAVSNVENYLPKIESDGKVEDGFCEGSLVALTAEEISGYVFYGWFKNEDVYGNTSASIEITVAENAKYTAFYKKLSKLSVGVEGEGYATISEIYDEMGEKNVFENAQESKTYTLYAEAKSGYEFVGWFDGDKCLGKEKFLHYVMENRDKIIVARFEKKSQKK